MPRRLLKTSRADTARLPSTHNLATRPMQGVARVGCGLAPLSWRMPPGNHPESACGQDTGIVHPESIDRRTPRGGQTENPNAVLAPGKVLRPALHPRIEQRRQLAAVGIDRFDQGSPVAVAPSAGQPEVGLLRASSRSARNQVLDVHWAPLTRWSVRQYPQRKAASAAMRSRGDFATVSPIKAPRIWSADACRFARSIAPRLAPCAG